MTQDPQNHDANASVTAISAISADNAAETRTYRSSDGATFHISRDSENRRFALRDIDENHVFENAQADAGMRKTIQDFAAQHPELADAIRRDGMEVVRSGGTNVTVGSLLEVPVTGRTSGTNQR